MTPALEELRFQRIHPDARLPIRAHPHDAGLDLAVVVPVSLEPGERIAAPTGLVVAIPPGHVGLVHPRSGLSLRRGVTVVNAPGTVDAGYRGELRIALVNLSNERVSLPAGERVAQLLVQPVDLPTAVEADGLADEATARGTGGFGSSG